MDPVKSFTGKAWCSNGNCIRALFLCNSNGRQKIFVLFLAFYVDTQLTTCDRGAFR